MISTTTMRSSAGSQAGFEQPPQRSAERCTPPCTTSSFSRRGTLTIRWHSREIARQVRIVTRFLPKRGRYLEIGAGTCRVASQVALSADEAYAVEVSAEIVPPNAGVQVLLGDGPSIPVEPGTIDLVYSHQVMEHLHPDDAIEQVRNVRRALAPGGAYVCITPNRATGPHDISGYFGDTPRGFHLREYTIRELRRLFLEADFRDVRVAVALGGEIVAIVPSRPYVLAETLLARLPRRELRLCHPVRKFFDPGPIVALIQTVAAVLVSRDC